MEQYFCSAVAEKPFSFVDRVVAALPSLSRTSRGTQPANGVLLDLQPNILFDVFRQCIVNFIVAGNGLFLTGGRIEIDIMASPVS